MIVQFARKGKKFQRAYLRLQEEGKPFNLPIFPEEEPLSRGLT
jgi:hypothetical protein